MIRGNRASGVVIQWGLRAGHLMEVTTVVLATSCSWSRFQRSRLVRFALPLLMGGLRVYALVTILGLPRL